MCVCVCVCVCVRVLCMVSIKQCCHLFRTLIVWQFCALVSPSNNLGFFCLLFSHKQQQIFTTCCCQYHIRNQRTRLPVEPFKATLYDRFRNFSIFCFHYIHVNNNKCIYDNFKTAKFGSKHIRYV